MVFTIYIHAPMKTFDFHGAFPLLFYSLATTLFLKKSRYIVCSYVGYIKHSHATATLVVQQCDPILY